VTIYELQGRGLSEDDVLIMGTDGLWDVTTNKKAAEIVKASLKQFDSTERARSILIEQHHGLKCINLCIK
jgi:protein phosphatase 1H